DEQGRMFDLPRAASEEPAKLVLDRTPLPLWLLLKRAERRELSTRLEHGLDALRAERPDQLALEVGVADVEAQVLELFSRSRRPDADALESPAERGQFAG